MSDKVLKVSVISLGNIVKIRTIEEFEDCFNYCGSVVSFKNQRGIRNVNVFIPLESVLYFSETRKRVFSDGEFEYFYIALRDRINLSTQSSSSSYERVFVVEGDSERIVPILLNENIEK